MKVGAHSKTVARFMVDGRELFVVLNWSGATPEGDPDRFYDIFDSSGTCLNEGEPWHDDGSGAPTKSDLMEVWLEKEGAK